MEYSEVSQASTITKITLISKIQGEICLQIKQPWALLKSWKASIQNDDGKRDDSGDFTINGHFTCQCKLFVGVRYPISWLLRRGLKRLCFKSGEALQVHQQPWRPALTLQLKQALNWSQCSLHPRWSFMFLSVKISEPVAGRMILHRILCRILRCDSVPWHNLGETYEYIGYHNVVE